MGGGQSTSNRSKKSPSVFEILLKNATPILQAPTCKDLITYRQSLRPMLEKLVGSNTAVIPLTVERERIFEIAIGYYKGQKTEKHERLIVTFISGGRPEKALDGCGVRREFYSLFFQSCLQHEYDMFEGKGRRRVPSNNMDVVAGRLFEALGRAIVSSILNGDCGFPYLAPAAFFYLVGQEYEEHLSLDDVPDPTVKHLVKKILEAKNEDELTDIVAGSEGEVINYIGWPRGQAITMENRHILAQQLIRWSTIEERKTSLDQLKVGLSHMGFLEMASRNDLQVLPLFVYSEEYSVTSDYIQCHLKPAIEALTPLNDAETKSKEYALKCIQELTDEESERLFQFITGLLDPSITEESIQVEFNRHFPLEKLPQSNTCCMLLRIPVANESLDEFRQSFKIALQNSEGFGCY